MKLFNLNLKQQIILPIVLLLIVGFSIMTIVSVRNARDGIETMVKSEVTQVAEMAGKRLSDWIENEKGKLENWSQIRMFQKASASSGNAKSVQKEASRLLAEYSRRFTEFESIALTNKNGIVVSAADYSAVKMRLDLSGREYFRKSFTGSTVISKVVINKSTGQPGFVISAPLYKTGSKRVPENITGIVLGVIKMESLYNRILASVKIGTTGNGYIMNREGMFISHGNSENILKVNMKDFPFGNQFFEKDKGLVDYTWKGENKVAGYVTLPETGWVLAVAAEKEKLMGAAVSIRNMMLIIGAAMIILVTAGVWIIAGGISRSVDSVKDVIREMSGGNFSSRLNLARKDEIGMMAANLDAFADAMQNIVIDTMKKIADGDVSMEIESKSDDDEIAPALKKMVETIRGIIAEIQNLTQTLAGSSEELSAVSDQLASGSEEMTAQSNGVAGATEQMSTNINTMASAAEEMSVNAQSVSSTAEQMSINMNSIASAIEEMTVAIGDVAGNAQEGEKVSVEAMKMSETATNVMNVLGDAAKQIGEVTEVIKRIADQTNLLALNATIEAASAGDAGKGFAVVANEIKELANQSARAADDIANRIEGVQTNSEESIRVIDDISGIINTMNEFSQAIAQAVEQQGHTANEISANVQQANSGADNIANAIAEVAKGANDMSENAGEAAMGTNEVASSIQEVSKAATESSAGAQQVNSSASELAEVAGELQQIVKQFVV